MRKDNEPKSLKIRNELHHELDKLRAELGVKMNELVSAILWEAIKNGPEAVWKVIQRYESTPPEEQQGASTKKASGPRSKSQSRNASGAATHHNAR